MKILVTGGAGFIGSHLCERLLAKKHNVLCLDDFNNYYNPKIKKSNLKRCISNPKFRLFKADITNLNELEKIFSKNKIDKIIHLAARAGVRASMKNPKLYEKVNANGTKNLLDLCVKYNIRNFIFGSSSSIYGTNKKTPFSESDRINNQISPYAKTKKAGELLCKKYHKKHNLNIFCLRFFTVYGPRGRPDMAPYKFVDLITKAKPIQIYLEEKEFNKGKMARDFTYVEDIVQGIILAADKVKGFSIFNLGNGRPVKLNKFIKTIEKSLRKKAKKEFIGRQKGDVLVTYADISKAKKILGYKPKISVEKGMDKFVSWYKEQDILTIEEGGGKKERLLSQKMGVMADLTLQILLN